MSKELEALKRIGKLEVKGLRVVPTKTIVKDYNDYRIIETALKDYHFCLYIIDKICKYLSIDVSSHRDLIETENEILNTLVENEKKLKALEIIKEKQVNVYSFIQKNPKTFEEYQDIDDEIEQLSEVSLSKIEFDLLKEVLK